MLIVGTELFARYYLGLGDPPLMTADPEIEYLYRPAQTCYRFGRRVHFNAYGMRCEDFPPHKADPAELRVMVVGDSVVVGNMLRAQDELATSILHRRLREALGGRPVVVGNIGAGSWGPANELAYVKRFGLFGADVVVVVQSSHDVTDEPTFDPKGVGGGDAPTRKPLLALEEVIFRYIPRKIWAWRHPDFDINKRSDPGPPPPEVARRCLGALGELVATARASGATVILAQHMETGELDAKPFAGHAMIEWVGREQGVRIVQLGPLFQAERAAGRNPYDDMLHPSAAGHRLIADALLPEILDAVQDRTEGRIEAQDGVR